MPLPTFPLHTFSRHAAAFGHSGDRDHKFFSDVTEVAKRRWSWAMESGGLENLAIDEALNQGKQVSGESVPLHGSIDADFEDFLLWLGDQGERLCKGGESG